jgi:hypothetical protein
VVIVKAAGRSRIHPLTKGITGRKLPSGEERISISRLELVSRLSEGGEEGVVGVPEVVADSLAGGEKERSGRFLGARRDGVWALASTAWPELLPSLHQTAGLASEVGVEVRHEVGELLGRVLQSPPV